MLRYAMVGSIVITMGVSGCAVNVRGRERPLVKHGPIEGHVELASQWQKDQNKSPNETRTSTSTLFEEKIRFKTEGDVVDPDFMLYAAGIGFGLAQDRLRSDDVSQSSSDFLKEYNLSLSMLRNKPYPAGFYANRSEDLISRQFLGPLRSERDNATMVFNWKLEGWPMRFDYSINRDRQESLSNPSTDFYNRDSDIFRYMLTHDFTENSHLTFDFERNEVRQQSAGSSTQYQQDRYSLRHEYEFGLEKKHRLSSYLDYHDQSGAFDLQNLQWEEMLRLQHSDDFSTFYSARYHKSRQTDSQSDEYSARAGYTHRLYGNFLSSGSVYGSRADFGGGNKLDQQGGILSIDYYRNNPLGILLGTYSVNVNRVDIIGDAGTASVAGEEHNASDVVLVELNRPNIITSSIVVKHTDNVSIYTLGEDYQIIEENGRTKLRFIFNPVPSSFPDFTTVGQLFKVDYDYLVDPERTEDTLNQAFTVRQRFKNGISVYYEQRRQSQTIDSQMDNTFPDEYTHHTYGADYSWKNLFLLAEYIDRKSALVPSTGTRYEGRYNWAVNPDTTVSLFASNQDWTFQETQPRDLEIFRTGFDLYSRLSGRQTFNASIDYRNEKDSRFGNTEGFQVRGEMKYIYRKLNIRFGVETSMLKRRSSTHDNLFSYIRLQRSF